MRVILLKDIKGVGKKFEEKDVADGHALNFLIPQKLAVNISGQNKAQIEQIKIQSEKKHTAEDKKIEEKEAKREAKRLELEKFRQEQSALKQAQKRPSS